ncbi:hypothetical protein AB0L13_28910 [Saccharopolyspora shandongensis]|uniref:hypothetical protein n=1 Tax=Saccharopolyspora shandongensis TaxID=418495 RepID=UPI00341B9616
MFAATVGRVREAIHSSNTHGFAALDPKWSGGRPAKSGPAARERKSSKDRDFAAKMARIPALYRFRVHRTALLHPRRQRLPLPHRPRSRHRWLHPLG